MTYVLAKVHAISFWLLRWLVHLALTLLRLLDWMNQVGEAGGGAEVISAWSPHILLWHSLRGQINIMSRIVRLFLRLDKDWVLPLSASVSVEAESLWTEIRGGRFLAHLYESTLQLVRSKAALIVEDVLACISKLIVSGYWHFSFFTLTNYWA